MSSLRRDHHHEPAVTHRPTTGDEPAPTEPDRRGLRRGMPIVPSLFTLANLFCGWACVVHAMRGELVQAVPFIGLAIVFDVLDGRIARMTGTTSDFGGELDSLADLVSFGVAPAVLAFQWGLQPLGWVGGVAGFLYVTTAALRLARFNVATPTDKRHFVGLPSPAAAAVVATTVFYRPDSIVGYHHALLALLVVLVPAALMVSTVPYRSFKAFDVHAHRTYQWVLVFAALGVAIVGRPHEALAVLACVYLLSAPVRLVLARLRPDHLGPTPLTP